MHPSRTREPSPALPLIASIALLIAALCPSPASAQPERPGDACGTNATPADRQRALDFKQRAFAHHKKARFADAAPLYARAVDAWDHPEFRLALARVLFLEARLLEAHEHASQALRCPQALDSDDERARARALLARLESQLARIDVRSPDASTEILLNGTRWFGGQDALAQHRIVYPGQYEVTARRPGYITVRAPLSVASGERATVTPQLLSRRDATTYTRWLPRWQPWLVVGASAGLLAVSGGLDALARAEFAEFDSRWAEQCGGGCLQDEQPQAVAILRRAEAEVLAARIAVAVGGAGLLTGAVLLLLNRPQPQIDESAGSAPVQITPLVAPGAAGVSALGRF